ncbi:MAG: hypothetical protein OSA98_25130 [Rubripirellula sp.]|nr:hypothetical protein [Rubripirellula sp.]
MCDSPEKLRGDDQFIQALVSGCHIDKAAGTSVRTAYRLLADPNSGHCVRASDRA